MALLAHLRDNKASYGRQLVTAMDQALQETSSKYQLRSIADSIELLKTAQITEQDGGKLYVLTYLSEGSTLSPEEAVLRVQGYIVNSSLPPVRANVIPRNTSRLINLKQSITLTGLGAEPFDDAVKGVMFIYQAFQTAIVARGGQLRQWKPLRKGVDFVLSFANRYLTRAQDVGDEAPVDLADSVDPLNVLRPLLRSEIHVQDNVVEYWQRGVTESGWTKFDRIKPDVFMTTHLVEVQVSFTAVKVGRNEYAFLPRLRAICLLDRNVEKDWNTRVVDSLFVKPRSPMKKTKRKVGYGAEGGVVHGTDLGMKRLRIDDDESNSLDERDECMS